jgi:tRNA threonylcarbamoyladenosine biosynthesis protein TsaB
MGEVYWAQYRFADAWRAVVEPALAAPVDVKPRAADVPMVACGNGLAAYGDAFSGRDFMASARGDILPHASQIARLGAMALANGGGVEARHAQPIYLRNKVALTTRERLMAKAEADA